MICQVRYFEARGLRAIAAGFFAARGANLYAAIWAPKAGMGSSSDTGEAHYELTSLADGSHSGHSSVNAGGEAAYLTGDAPA